MLVKTHLPVVLTHTPTHANYASCMLIKTHMPVVLTHTPMHASHASCMLIKTHHLPVILTHTPTHANHASCNARNPSQSIQEQGRLFCASPQTCLGNHGYG